MSVQRKTVSFPEIFMDQELSHSAMHKQIFQLCSIDKITMLINRTELNKLTALK